MTKEWLGRVVAVGRAGRYLIAATVCVSLLGGLALAEDPTVDDYIKALKPKLTRGLSRGTSGITPETRPESGVVSMHVNFEFNSARLTADAVAKLGMVRQATRSITIGSQKSVEWLVVGHTDAVGTADANRALSLERAKAVRNQLVTSNGVPEGTVYVWGAGKDHPIEKVDGPSEVNRRVEIFNCDVVPEDCRKAKETYGVSG